MVFPEDIQVSKMQIIESLYFLPFFFFLCMLLITRFPFLVTFPSPIDLNPTCTPQQYHTFPIPHTSLPTGPELE